MESDTFEQVEGDGLLSQPSQAGWLDRRGIELLTFIDDRVENWRERRTMSAFCWLLSAATWGQ